MPRDIINKPKPCSFCDAKGEALSSGGWLFRHDEECYLYGIETDSMTMVYPEDYEWNLRRCWSHNG